jgi:hypothetical protein
MYKLLVFRLFLHYILGRAVDTCDFSAVYGSWHHLCLLCPGLQERGVKWCIFGDNAAFAKILLCRKIVFQRDVGTCDFIYFGSL